MLHASFEIISHRATIFFVLLDMKKLNAVWFCNGLQINEKKYLNECIDSTFVSSIGKFVDEFEEKIAENEKKKYDFDVDVYTKNIGISFEKFLSSKNYDENEKSIKH